MSINKGGHNEEPSQITQRPGPPPASNPRPHTAEDMAALPEGGGVGMEIYEFTDADRRRGYAEIKGTRVDVHQGVKSVTFPVFPDVVCFYSAPSDVLMYRDGKGIWWKLGRYADGRWFREWTYPNA